MKRIAIIADQPFTVEPERPPCAVQIIDEVNREWALTCAMNTPNVTKVFVASIVEKHVLKSVFVREE